MNGSLLRQTTYSQNASGFHLLNQVSNTYESVISPQYHYDVPAVFKGERFTDDGTEVTEQRLYFYPIPVNWVRLVSTTSRQFDPQNETRFTTATTRYTYDTLASGHMQISQTCTKRSDGSTLLTNTRYPADYPGVTTGALVAMRSDAVFQHAAPVETMTQVYGPSQSPADAKTISGTYTEYIPAGSAGRYQPGTSSALELTQPLSGLSTAVSGNLPPTGRYLPRVQLSYEATTGNLQQVLRSHGTPTTYLWGYNSTLPIAKLDNASATQTQAALTTMGWNPNTPASDTQLQNSLAQLRQLLPQAQLTGFTHRPLIGVSSQMDPSGRIISYEYDALGRLQRARDEQGRVLTEQQYHYARP